MTWLPGTDDPLELTPAIGTRLRELDDGIWASLDPGLLELCRARIRRLILFAESAAPVKHSGGELSTRERSCTDFAELFVIDAHAITDEQCAELNRHLSPPELTALTMAIAVFEATARSEMALGVDREGAVRHAN